MKDLYEKLENCETIEDMLDLHREFGATIKPKLNRLNDVDRQLEALRKEHSELMEQVDKFYMGRFEERLMRRIGEKYLSEKTKKYFGEM